MASFTLLNRERKGKTTSEITKRKTKGRRKRMKMLKIGDVGRNILLDRFVTRDGQWIELHGRRSRKTKPHLLSK